MTEQYKTSGELPVATIVKPITERISDQKIHRMDETITLLQQELNRYRSDIAKLKNRVSELERSISPRG